jgi:uncharacterized membrane protein YphA (DoxX/SURF4 family)
MNIALWIVQIVLGAAFVAAGISHGFRPDRMKSQQGGQWVAAVPRWLLTVIGICEILGGIGVILPAATGILAGLTPLAATLLSVLMLLAAGFHFFRREFPNIIFNLVLFALAAFVAYGRFALV